MPLSTGSSVRRLAHNIASVKVTLNLLGWGQASNIKGRAGRLQKYQG